jgi:hypothetical protein
MGFVKYPLLKMDSGYFFTGWQGSYPENPEIQPDKL